MELKKKWAYAAIGSLVITLVVSGCIFLGVHTEASKEVTKLTWQRTGGFGGLNEELVIEPDGSASYRSNRFGDLELVLTEVELKGLLSLLESESFFTLDRSYVAKPNVADYFNYRLTVQSTSGAKTVEWVDGWASEETIPSVLGELQLYIQAIVEGIHQDMDVSGEADERAVKIAIDFVVQAPTFKYDGISDTLEVIDVKILESFPVQYVVTITFDSRHAGYGDRTGQVLAQVITPHTEVVKVVDDEVVSAILDNQWDELRQEPVPIPTPQAQIICPQDGSPYVWSPIGSRSENFNWRCLRDGYTWTQTYPEEVYQKWKKAFLEPVFVRDYTIFYLQDIGYEDMPDPFSSNWAGGRVTPPGIVGAETYEYSVGEFVVITKYPVVLPENTKYDITIERREKVVWHGQLLQRQFTSPPSPTAFLMDFEAAVGFARDPKGPYRWMAFSGFQHVGDFHLEPFKTDEVQGNLLWWMGNDSLYEAEYPSGRILGEVERILGLNDTESYYVWKITILDPGKGGFFYIDARNGEGLIVIPYKGKGTIPNPTPPTPTPTLHTGMDIMLIAIVIGCMLIAVAFYLGLRRRIS